MKIARFFWKKEMSKILVELFFSLILNSRYLLVIFNLDFYKWEKHGIINKKPQNAV